MSEMPVPRASARMKRTSTTVQEDDEPPTRRRPERPAGAHHYIMRFKNQWLDDKLYPEFQGWLTDVEGKPGSAFCLSCNTELVAHKSALSRHCTSIKHLSQKGGPNAETAKAAADISDDVAYTVTIESERSLEGESAKRAPRRVYKDRSPRIVATRSLQVDNTPSGSNNLSLIDSREFGRYPEKVKLKAEILKINAEREKFTAETTFWELKSSKIRQQLEILQLEKLKLQRDMGMLEVHSHVTIDQGQYVNNGNNVM